MQKLSLEQELKNLNKKYINNFQMQEQLEWM